MDNPTFDSGYMSGSSCPSTVYDMPRMTTQRPLPRREESGVYLDMDSNTETCVDNNNREPSGALSTIARDDSGLYIDEPQVELRPLPATRARSNNNPIYTYTGEEDDAYTMPESEDPYLRPSSDIKADRKPLVHTTISRTWFYILTVMVVMSMLLAAAAIVVVILKTPKTGPSPDASEVVGGYADRRKQDEHLPFKVMSHNLSITQDELKQLIAENNENIKSTAAAADIITKLIDSRNELKQSSKIAALQEQIKSLSFNLSSTKDKLDSKAVEENQIETALQALFCPPRYYLNPVSMTCVRLVTKGLIWNEANDNCLNSSETLAVFPTLTEVQWIQRQIENIHNIPSAYPAIWIGLRYTGTEWRWKGRVTDPVLTSDPVWSVGEPAFFTPNYCGALYHVKKRDGVSDRQCDNASRQYSLCERQSLLRIDKKINDTLPKRRRFTFT